MEKLYVVKENNKNGKELFKGENYKLAIINNKHYNLIGDIDIDKPTEAVICNSKTGKYLQYGIIFNINRIVDDNVKGSFIILK